MKAAVLHSLTGHDLKAESTGSRLVEIGEIAGPTIFEAFPQIWALAGDGALRIDTEPVPLADVERAWQQDDAGGRRMVIIP